MHSRRCSVDRSKGRDSPEAGETLPAVAIKYGAFLYTVIEFLIVALSVFVGIKFMNRMLKQRSIETV